MLAFVVTTTFAAIVYTLFVEPLVEISKNQK
jgi:type II secretory pathway component PulM